MADSRRVRITPPTTDHQIDVTTEPSKCGTSGHRDHVVVCSCGFLHRTAHMDREGAQKAILYHRLHALEQVVGMNIKIEWAAGT